jgi:hypothetical protein
MKRRALALTLIMAMLFSAVAGLTLFDLVVANPVFPSTEIEILSPQNNETYLTNNFVLNFTVLTHNAPYTQYIGTPSIQCYVDGKLFHQINLTDLTDLNVEDLPRNFSVSLSGLNSGQHNVFVTKTAVYYLVMTTYSENASSRVVYFSVYPSPPRISLVSPQNQSYQTTDVPVNFTARVDYGAVSWMGYSLDGQDNVTTTGNTTLTGLSEGEHNITFYATDTYGRIGASETITFTIAEPFPTTLVIAASGASIAAIGLALLVYFKKRKHQNIPSYTISNND